MARSKPRRAYCLKSLDSSYWRRMISALSEEDQEELGEQDETEDKVAEGGVSRDGEAKEWSELRSSSESSSDNVAIVKESRSLPRGDEAIVEMLAQVVKELREIKSMIVELKAEQGQKRKWVLTESVESDGRKKARME